MASSVLNSCTHQWEGEGGEWVRYHEGLAHHLAPGPSASQLPPSTPFLWLATTHTAVKWCPAAYYYFDGERPLLRPTHHDGKRLADAVALPLAEGLVAAGVQAGHVRLVLPALRPEDVGVWAPGVRRVVGGGMVKNEEGGLGAVEAYLGEDTAGGTSLANPALDPPVVRVPVHRQVRHVERLATDVIAL